ncbi:hypothetical protein DL98DRAFT_238649 [Cadophora sp. DSE1049]|nr:hypothetical protein DL98DRAFT_238649 [Cadophora sp. DSE1049]
MASNQPTMTTTSDLQEQTKVNFLPLSHDTTFNIIEVNKENDEIPTKATSFPILSLPLELRLKIYTYILPPRHHKTSSVPSQTSYPFGHSAPLAPSGTPLSIPYKILTSNTHASFPHSTITASLLRTCKQIHYEAEPVLYGCKETVWDFGVHLEAVRGFWGERSRVARECVRGVRVAWEVPAWSAFENGGGGEMLGRKAVVWMRSVDYLRNELTGLRGLDLMLWCVDGSASGFPRGEEMSKEDVNQPVHACGLDQREQLQLSERRANFEMEKKWRQWKWTEDLLSMPSLGQTKITCWSAVTPKMEEVIEFGMVKDGVVVSQEVVVLSSTSDWLRSYNTVLDGAQA